MFDVSFFELLVIGVVALVVIGPERLPDAIKTCALWIGRMKRILAESRSEFEKHIGADEIRRELHNEHIMASLEKLKASRAVLEQDLLNYQNTIQAELHALEHGTQATLHDHDDHAPSIESAGESKGSEPAEAAIAASEVATTDHSEVDISETKPSADTNFHHTEEPALKTKPEHE
ncbi:MAG TPA: Sec-independent protein translocase protein TatB [Cellvibrionaceae bacterium]